MTSEQHASAARPDQSTAPQRGTLVLLALILVAAVANLNLAVANVALPSIGKAFDSSQTTLNLVAVGYSLGLAGSVLWLGALGDRYGRKLMLLVGTELSIPICLLAAYSPSDEMLVVAPIQVAVNCQVCPVLRLVALSTRIGTLLARRQLWSFGLKSLSSSLGMILSSLSQRFRPPSPSASLRSWYPEWAGRCSRSCC